MLDILRVVSTVLMPVAFLGIVFWAYSDKRKQAFAEAAMLPFADDRGATDLTDGESAHE